MFNILLYVCIALGIGVLCRYFLFNITINVGQSMKPTTLDGDVTIVNRLIYWIRSPKVNELVMMTDPEKKRKQLHKRIVHENRNEYIVRGDNINNSRDSRSFGLVPRKRILGRTELVLFSFDRIKKRFRWNRFFKRVY